MFLKIFLSKEEKEKSDNMVVSDIKICKKMKNQRLLSIGKILFKKALL